MIATVVESSLTGRNWVAAGAGFTLALGLVVAVELVSLRQSRSVEADVGRLVYEAERSTYLIGDIGQLLSRLQANLVEVATADRADIADARTRSQEIDEELETRLGELTGHLSPEELSVWRAIEPEVATLRTSLARALGLVEAGDAPAAGVVLDGLAGPSRRVFDSLQGFLAINQVTTRTQMNAANKLLASTRTGRGAIAALQLLGIAAVGLVAMRAIRRKEAAFESYLQRIERDNDELVAFAGRVAYELPLYATALRGGGRAIASR